MVLHKSPERMSKTLVYVWLAKYRHSIRLALAYIQGHAAGIWYTVLVNLTNG